MDRSLLVISDQEGGTVGRLPGQLNGRQFRIKNCRDVSILILDNTDSVTVEKCINCQIFIAPTKGRYLLSCLPTRDNTASCKVIQTHAER